MAFGSINFHSAWLAWHLGIFGALGTYFTGLPLVARLVPTCLCGGHGIWKHRPPFCVAGVAVCVAGVAFGSIDFHSVWQAWHLATSNFTSCGRRGTYGTGLALVGHLVAAVCGGRGI